MPKHTTAAILITVMLIFGFSYKALAEPPSPDRIESLRGMNSTELAALTEPLIELLNNEDSAVRRNAARDLFWVAKCVPVPFFSVDALIKTLGDEDRMVRFDVSRILGLIGPKAKAAVPELIGVLTEDDWGFVRIAAAGSLCQIGPAAKAAIPVLMVTIKDPVEDVRGGSALALGNFGPDAKAAVPALIEALEDSFRVSGPAANALGNIGPGAESAIPALNAAMKRDHAMLRIVAASAMLRIDPKADAAAVIIDVLENGDMTERRVAAMYAGKLGPHAKSVAPALAPALVEALNDDNAKLRIAAAESLHQIEAGATDSVAIIAKALTDDDAGVRRTAALALSRMGTSAKAAIPALTRARSDGDKNVRHATADALHRIQSAANGSPQSE